MSIVQGCTKIYNFPWFIVVKTTGKWLHLLFLCCLVPDEHKMFPISVTSNIGKPLQQKYSKVLLFLYSNISHL